MLVVLRGNSGSGKSTLAAALQHRLGWPTAILGVDHFRRIVYKERLEAGQVAGMAHADLLEAAARHCLASRQHVILEGIFQAHLYADLLQRTSTLTEDARFYAYDLSFDETIRRHGTRPQARDFTPEQMREWFHGWDPLPFVEEHVIDPDESLDEVVQRVLHHE